MRAHAAGASPGWWSRADLAAARDRHAKVDAQTLAFDVPVPAGGDAVLRYRIQVGW